MRTKPVKLSGWGRAITAESNAFRPECERDLASVLAATENTSLLCYGCGRSYGDAALNHQGNTILTERMSRLLQFDETNNTLVCEAGVTLHDINQVFLPRGLAPIVSAGTAYTSVGGAIANDIHGKNHEKQGSFAQHVLWLELLMASGESRRLTPQDELFRATVGGVGLTGIITKACVQLHKTPAWVRTHEVRIANYDEFYGKLNAARQTSTYSVGWLDSMASGKNLGRGLLKLAEPYTESTKMFVPERKKSLPLNFPNWVLNRSAVNLFNRWYYYRVPKQGKTTVMNLPQFLYPLDSVLNWNRMYGSRGFYQFQCVLPESESYQGIKMLLQEIARYRSTSFLTVLKALGDEGLGLLSFPLRGFTLALDFPNRPGVLEVLHKLEQITLDFNGRIYLAKDACMQAASFRRMYPKAKRLAEILNSIDPNQRFDSNLARRLNIRNSFYD